MESTDKMIDDAIARIHVNINARYMWEILKINGKLIITGNGAIVLHDEKTIIHVKEEAFKMGHIPYHIPMPDPIDYLTAHRLLYGGHAEMGTK